MLYSIEVQDLGKSFRRPQGDRPSTLKETLLQGLWQRDVEEFWALRDVSFKVERGHMLGIIGKNGSGKSTLLRMLGGVVPPDEGTIEIAGKVGALLDLGAGFHPDLTGRETVFVSGVVAGLTHREVAKVFDDIVAFAELQAFIDSPLRTYSTGMQMRLAFAIAIHSSPEILLVDEVLAVGDISFQRKCLDKIAELKTNGCTIILVSHDPQQIRQLCDQVIWLRYGELIADGNPTLVVEQYVAEMTEETRRRTPDRPSVYTPSGSVLEVNKNRFGSLEMEITGVRLLDADGYPITELDSGRPLRIEIQYLALQPIQNPIFGVTISPEQGQACFDVCVPAASLALPVVHGQGKVTLCLDRLDLNQGYYYIDVGIHEQDWTYTYDYHCHVYSLQICSNGSNHKGLLRPPHFWAVDSTDVSRLKHCHVGAPDRI